jgi:hypothetical protein
MDQADKVALKNPNTLHFFGYSKVGPISQDGMAVFVKRGKISRLCQFVKSFQENRYSLSSPGTILRTFQL